jgi:hypothetical protein
VGGNLGDSIVVCSVGKVANRDKGMCAAAVLTGETIKKQDGKGKKNKQKEDENIQGTNWLGTVGTAS